MIPYDLYDFQKYIFLQSFKSRTENCQYPLHLRISHGRY